MEPSMAHIIRQSIIKEPWSSLIYSPSLFASVSQLQTFSFFWKSFISWLKTWSHWLAYHIQGCYVFAKLFWKGCFVPLGKFSCFCGFCVLLRKCKSFEIEKGFGAFCILHSTLPPCQSPFSQLAWNWLRLFGNPEDEVPSKPAILDLTAANKDGPTENGAPLTLRF